VPILGTCADLDGGDRSLARPRADKMPMAVSQALAYRCEWRTPRAWDAHTADARDGVQFEGHASHSRPCEAKDMSNAERVAVLGRVLVITGAGMSADSGVPTFRGSNG
jgi:hypothetical protein